MESYSWHIWNMDYLHVLLVLVHVGIECTYNVQHVDRELWSITIVDVMRRVRSGARSTIYDQRESGLIRRDVD